MKKKQIMNILAKDVRGILENQDLQYEYLQEIRLRIGHPVILCHRGKEILCDQIATEKTIRETLDYVSNYSLYAYENELRQGFITVEGGHRIGMAGQAILENGHIKNLKHIASLNIRISHEILDCANPLFQFVTKSGQLYHTMIISPPRCGKTTLLRDLIRQISDGNQWLKGHTVGVVDERSELAGCYHGVPQNHIGMRTDVMDGCPKAEGMMMLIRSMSPQVIAVDEIGSGDDVQAIRYAMHCGCKMLTTVHGQSMEEIRRKPLFAEMIKERCFERYIVLHSKKQVGEIAGIYDEKGSLLYGEDICKNG